MLNMVNGGALSGATEAEKGIKMKVEILRNTVAAKEPVRIGDVVDLPEDEAKRLIGLARARAAKPGATLLKQGKPAVHQEKKAPTNKTPSSSTKKKSEGGQKEDSDDALESLTDVQLIEIAKDRGLEIADGATREGVLTLLKQK